MYISCCGGGDVQYDDCASHPETEQEVAPYRKAQQERQQQQQIHQQHHPISQITNLDNKRMTLTAAYLLFSIFVC